MSTIFTDGSSRGNPGPGGYGYIVISGSFVEEGGGREEMTTNNRMELTAVIEALKKAEGEIVVYLDSAYVLNGITKWVYGWQKNNWVTSQKENVLNKDLWQQLVEVTKNKKIEWKLLKGHAGIKGNERCDEIATGNRENLYKGEISNYDFDPFDMTSSVVKNKNKGKAYSYVSLVDGVVFVHQTWAECEARVKGAKGARYKKALNKAEEEDLIKSLGNL